MFPHKAFVNNQKKYSQVLTLRNLLSLFMEEWLCVHLASNNFSPTGELVF